MYICMSSTSKADINLLILPTSIPTHKRFGWQGGMYVCMYACSVGRNGARVVIEAIPRKARGCKGRKGGKDWGRGVSKLPGAEYKDYKYCQVFCFLLPKVLIGCPVSSGIYLRHPSGETYSMPTCLHMCYCTLYARIWRYCTCQGLYVCRILCMLYAVCWLD
jgi:hypothetical protein